MKSSEAAPPPLALADTVENQRTRLYVSPWTSDIERSFLAALKLESVPNVTVHHIQTVPERPFGFLVLHSTDAERVRKKFNGLILRGAKIRIEAAKPRRPELEDLPMGKSRRPDPTGEPSVSEVRETRLRKKESAKEKNEVSQGIELPEGRSVKRAWKDDGEEKDRKRRKTAKHSDRDEKPGRKNTASKVKDEGRTKLVFKTELPLNVATKTDEGTDAAKKTRSKKRRSKHKEKRPKADIEVTEFSKTTKYPSFLKDKDLPASAAATRTFEDGKGWIDEQGNLIEAVAVKRQPRITVEPPSASAERAPSAVPADGDESHSSHPELDSDSQPISRFSSPAPERSPEHPTIEQPSHSPVDQPADSPPVHPLEALFKRPKPVASTPSGKKAGVPAPIKTNFSFFDSDPPDADADAEHEPSAAYRRMQPPQTPFTKRDMEQRAVRSAAPTPDTAALGGPKNGVWGFGERRRSSSFADISEDKEEEDEEDEEAGSEQENRGEEKMGDGAVNAQVEGENEFEQMFWKNRGEHNRAWKKVRRDAVKEDRKLRRSRR